ncbi:unnamed protein product, partial [Rotaria sp. Silwood1]
MGQENMELLVQGLEPNPIWIKGKIHVTIADNDNEKPSNSKAPVAQMTIIEKVDKRIIAIPLNSIVSIQGENLKTTLTKKIVKPILQIYYKNKSNSNCQGVMKYLTFGITWVPSYNLNLMAPSESSVKNLRLSMKCVMMNDIEDVNIKGLFCIVGHPNLSKYIDVIDPIFNTQSAKEFLDQLARCDLPSSSSWLSPSYQNANTRFNPRMNTSNYVVVPTDDEDVIINHDANDDFHLYKFHDVLLEQNEKLSLPIFDIEIPYKDIYHCKINPNKESTKHSDSTPGYGDHTITAE